MYIECDVIYQALVSFVRPVSGVSSSIKCGSAVGKSGAQSTVKLQYVKGKRKEQKDASFTAALSCPPLGRTQRIRYAILLFLMCFPLLCGLLESSNDETDALLKI